jgi:diaminopimelate epimerase
MALFSQKICDRHNGVGADGVEWIYPHAAADAEIRLINADGSEAEISGNGTRCVAAYLSASRKKEIVLLQTGAGVKRCVLISSRGSEFEFETDMGKGAAGTEFELRLDSSGKAVSVRGIPVSMGNPHYVVFVPEFAEGWQATAAGIQRSGKFEQGVNVEMVVAGGRNDLQVRFYERGVGETESSGTGSCAAAVAAVSSGRAEFPVRVHAPGGTQTVSQRHQSIYLRGAARLVCRGEFYLS